MPIAILNASGGWSYWVRPGAGEVVYTRVRSRLITYTAAMMLPGLFWKGKNARTSRSVSDGVAVVPFPWNCTSLDSLAIERRVTCCGLVVATAPANCEVRLATA